MNIKNSKENLSYFILECTGSLELSSAYHIYVININAEDMRKKKRNKNVQRISARDPGTRKWLRFEIVTFSGSCEWTVHEKRMGGGRNKRIASADTVLPGWPVRKVKLL